MIDENIPGYRLPHNEVDLVKLFGATEGEIALYYGHIRQGKTYGGAAAAIAAADSGLPVYVNFPMKYKGYDERESLFLVLLSLIWPWKDRFYHMKPSLIREFRIDDNWAQSQGFKDFWHWFKTRTDCLIIADEGHVMLDSYKKTYVSMEQRQAVLETGHFSRRLIIISQRPTAVHVSARGNVNIFYKFERLMRWPVLWFRRTEFQDMALETVDETKPLSTAWIFGSRRVMNAFNSKYLRQGLKASQNIDVDVYDFFYKEKYALFHFFYKALKKNGEIAAAEQKEKLKIIWANFKRPFIKVRPAPALAVPVARESAGSTSTAVGVTPPATDKLLRTGYIGPVLRKEEVAAVQLGQRAVVHVVERKTIKNEVGSKLRTSSDNEQSLF